ncbi:MAG TPA: ABC transporter substrate-binding protein [Microbacteriaceae bacterium]|nr:ABC transporter substrate-binding protein [Microbacteriaceae bacterium]
MAAFSSRARKAGLASAAGIALLGMTLAGCAPATTTDGEQPAADGDVLLVGTTDKVVSLDPAGAYDNGSLAIQGQVFPYLFNTQVGSAEVQPDLAVSAEFISDTEYEVKIREGVKWANGHDLTSSDVAFTFNRMLAIPEAMEVGPASLLGTLESVEAVDDTTVVFHLTEGPNAVFQQVLTSFPGAIVDEEVFSADAITPDDEIVAANAFGGPYSITSYTFNEVVELTPNENYVGLVTPAQNAGIIMNYYADEQNLQLAIEQGDVDVAFRSLSATAVEALRANPDVKVIDGPGGEIRYMVFNFATMPFGTDQPDADPAKALAVRQAMADLIDRDVLSEQVYKGTYTPLYSYVPEGFVGAIEPLKELYGDGNGGPSVEKATAALEAAGVATPVAINLQWSPDHYGASSADEYALIKDQLEASGLFTVTLGSTEWTQYAQDRVNDVYSIFQLGWFPDYSDADNYLTPFFSIDNFLVNHYENAEVDALIKQQAITVDPAERTAIIEQIQELVAADLSTLPYLQGAQVAVVGSTVEGAELDGSFKFRFSPLTLG